MIRIAIIDDNQTLRESLEKLFAHTESMRCVASLGSLQNVVHEMRKARPDIIIMDIGLPDISGIEGVRTVKNNFESIQIMMLTVFENDDKIFEAIREGADGYLLKKTPPNEIIEAILELYNGGSPMSPSVARKVIQYFQSEAPKKDNFQLTSREKEILFSLVDGLSYKKIADKYFLSVHTVRKHISSIYEKLHVHSKSQAVAKILHDQKGKQGA
ncbi:response regulator transcription factor [Puia dinghuensis]|uniref:DNA-binding response regulator n=1 Tax=Puia dinghuensis TaxID=1792502 RepID=A0A8J2XQF8_9BACT|nr:response regulator transcription factor [Puia dinghuensis]GGA84798.1 DNA-binding response regulator [Puia dinghuensis]